jgi:thiamine biosynthesis protein ThiS
MDVIVNGKSCSLPEPLTLAALLRSFAPATPFVVARNAEVVRPGAYEECYIQPGDQIEIVRPAAGG